MRGHFRKAPDDGQFRPKRIVPVIHIILYNNNRVCYCGIIHIFI
jgi:hypothetical protein